MTEKGILFLATAKSESEENSKTLTLWSGAEKKQRTKKEPADHLMKTISVWLPFLFLPCVTTWDMLLESHFGGAKFHN